MSEEYKLGESVLYYRQNVSNRTRGYWHPAEVVRIYKKRVGIKYTEISGKVRRIFVSPDNIQKEKKK